MVPPKQARRASISPLCSASTSPGGTSFRGRLCSQHLSALPWWPCGGPSLASTNAQIGSRRNHHHTTVAGLEPPPDYASLLSSRSGPTSPAAWRSCCSLSLFLRCRIFQLLWALNRVYAFCRVFLCCDLAGGWSCHGSTK